jgi:GT2 family glycosyltransferase
MDVRAPAVVAVLVTRDPGPWFEECLAALAAQDYEELSVLVIVSGGSADPTARVASVLPDAYVRRLEEDHGYGAATNEALSMVEGAAFYLLCHDDCAPDPDAVHVMVEESYRSNAGVVSPKMVRFDDPSVLLHVGMSADKTGTVVERVQVGEVDHGQHDAVRDVFVAPGGTVLVRADLLSELGGFDAGIVAMAEDLDLSWRVQVAGSRVVVAPDARVRHLEAVAGGLREVAPTADGERPTLQALQRRHELRAVLKCYTPFSLLRVVPQALLLALGEAIVALVVGDRARARAVVGAWTWNLRRLRALRQLRAQLRAHRLFPDKEVRRLQLRGSARLTTYFSRLAHQGFDVAHGRVPSGAETASPEGEGAEPVLTGSVGLAFSEDADFDELDDLGHRSGRDRHGRRRRRPALTSHRSRLVAALVATLVLVIGTRDLFGQGFPFVGQLAPFPNWGSSWGHLFAAWQPAGLGTTAPSTPAYGVMGVLGTALLGGMGLLQKVLVLGCVPLGAWGVSRLLRPLASPRARLVAAVAYLGVALPYDALAQGRWDGMVAYASLPWILSRLARAGGLPPAAATAPRSPGADNDGGSVPPAWRTTLPGQMLTLGAVEALAVAFAPAVAIDVLVCAAGIALGSVLVGQFKKSALGVLVVAGGATVVAAVLCVPWVVGTVLAGGDAVSIFGLAGSSATAPGWTELLRFAVGPYGSGVLSWFLLAAAVLPLLIGRQARLAWAARLWTVAACSWVLAWVVARGWTSPFAPTVDVLLAPAAVAVAAGVGLGVSAFENDLVGFRFGWRQLAAGVAVVVAVVGILPVVAAAGNGRWGLPQVGYAQPLSFLSPTQNASSSSGSSSSGAATTAAVTPGIRVLWLGDPRALPLGGWSMTPGLAYATSEDGPPAAGNRWAPASPGPAAVMAQDIELATEGRTSQLGRLLAPEAVRYVVVVESLAPEIEGTPPSQSFPAPANLVPALLQQTDLAEVPSVGGGLTVFENTTALPQRAQRAAGAVSRGAEVTPTDVAGWSAVLPGTAGSSRFQGTVGAGTVYAAYAPGGSWQLDVGGRRVAGAAAFGWAAQFPTAPPGRATLAVDTSPLVPLAVTAEVLLWLAVAAMLLGRRLWLDWWWRPLRRRAGRGRSSGDGPGTEADEGGDVGTPVPPGDAVGVAGT